MPDKEATMTDPRSYPDPSTRIPREEAESVGWLPIAIAGGIIAAIALFALTVPPPDQQSQPRADRPAISTDLVTTGQAIPKR
jgi:hypothetical protein